MCRTKVSTDDNLLENVFIWAWRPTIMLVLMMNHNIFWIKVSNILLFISSVMLLSQAVITCSASFVGQVWLSFVHRGLEPARGGQAPEIYGWLHPLIQRHTFDCVKSAGVMTKGIVAAWLSRHWFLCRVEPASTWTACDIVLTPGEGWFLSNDNVFPWVTGSAQNTV